MTRNSPDLSYINHWVFDLDNTLYPADSELMTQVSQRMTQYMSQMLDLPLEEALTLQKKYLAECGTTLNGLILYHDVDRHDFMDFVHDVDHSALVNDAKLVSLIRDLPGKKLVYTNGSLKHATNVLHHLGMNDLFDGIFDIEASGFTPKPHQESFDRFTEQFDLPVSQAIFFEDSLRNLKTAHEMGFTTVLVQAKEDEDAAHHPHVQYMTHCLRTFLASIRTTK